MRKVIIISVLSLISVFGFYQIGKVYAANVSTQLVNNMLTEDGKNECCKLGECKCDKTKCVHKKCAAHSSDKAKAASCQSKSTSEVKNIAAPVRPCCSAKHKPSTSEK